MDCAVPLIQCSVLLRETDALYRWAYLNSFYFPLYRTSGCRWLDSSATGGACKFCQNCKCQWWGFPSQIQQGVAMVRRCNRPRAPHVVSSGWNDHDLGYMFLPRNSGTARNMIVPAQNSRAQLQWFLRHATRRKSEYKFHIAVMLFYISHENYLNKTYQYNYALPFRDQQHNFFSV
jgi:hypothetical protein